jgi:hypothetical protein
MAKNGHSIYRTDEEVIEALYRTGGNIKETAAVLGLASVIELRKRINKDPVLREARLEASEQMLDVAEKVIADGLRKGTLKSRLETAKWYLPRKGRGRGYGDVTTNVNANLNANYDFSNVPLEERLKLLEMINGARTDNS